MSFKKSATLCFSVGFTCLLSVAIIIASCSSPSSSDSSEEEKEGENGEEQTLFAGGSGTSDDPYQIETLEHLQTLSAYGDYETQGYTADTMQHFMSAHYKQIADIDAEPAAGEEDSDGFGTGFQPIGTSESETYFTGSYDGSGHTISNLTMTREEQSGVGLFGFVADTVQSSDTIFKNITLENVSIIGRHSVGGIFGRYDRYGATDDQGNVVIRNSRVTGTITGEDGVGGLAGSAIKIEDSSADCSVTGTRGVGGLVGSLFAKLAEDNETVVTEARLVNSHATGKVIAVVREDAVGNKISPRDVGGLAGSFNGGLIKNAYATGNVESPINTPNNNFGGIGGLVGDFTAGQLRASFATGNVTGEFNVGGLVGSAGNNNHTVEITNSYATGNVKGDAFVGGFAVRVSGDISYSYAAGKVSSESSSGNPFIRNIQDGQVTDSYFDSEVTGFSESDDGSKGLTTSQMTGSSAEDDMTGFDFSQVWKTTESYPTLQWQE